MFLFHLVLVSLACTWNLRAESDENVGQKEAEENMEEFNKDFEDIENQLLKLNTYLLCPLCDKMTEFEGGVSYNFLIGIQNPNDEDVLIKNILGSLLYPDSSFYHVQNLTNLNYTVNIPSNTETTFSYNFKPSEELINHPFQFVIQTDYSDKMGDIQLKNTLYNRTIDIVHPHKSFDFEVIFIQFLIALLLITLFYVIYRLATKYIYKRSPKKAKVAIIETGATKNDIDFEWLPKHNIKL
ncbi:SSR-alpha [Intoshia linei]|uniref:Translocon-associated protein subunit alpha n=1 Tax=Intoshia linei TaxID=1819745 RepID=A0A177ARY9_9BILA|nr:SSR-alpha [Intoshia linei]